MTKLRLLTSVAATALLFAAGAASAQGMKEQQGTSRAPAAQQNAPAEKMAPPMNERKSTTGEATHEKAAPRNAQKERSKSSTTGAASEEKSEKNQMKGKSTTG